MRKAKKLRSVLSNDALIRMSETSKDVHDDESDELPLILRQDGFTSWAELDPFRGVRESPRSVAAARYGTRSLMHSLRVL